MSLNFSVIVKSRDLILTVILGVIGFILPAITSNVFLATSIFNVGELNNLSWLPTFLPYLLIIFNVIILLVLFVLFLVNLKKGNKLVWILSILFFGIILVQFSLTLYVLLMFMVVQSETIAITGIAF
jgi:hypothetical protein